MPDRRRSHALPFARALALATILAGPAGGAELSDPTRPATLPPPPTGAPLADAPRLDSVLLAADQRVAVIDGRRVSLGDQIAGGRIVAIELSGVRLRREGGDLLLTLSGGQYKRPASTTRKQP